MSDLIILMAWHEEQDLKKIRAFEENKNTFRQYNPKVNIIDVINPFKGKEAWLSTDLSVFMWYNNNRNIYPSDRYLIVEWDCWCNRNLHEYYSLVWDYDIVVPGVKYSERDEWFWFKSIPDLPLKAQRFATGIVPMCGVLLSNYAMDKICLEILESEYSGINSELRLGTISTMLGLDPIVNPVCNRTISWKGISALDQQYKGLHHPRKTLY